MPEASLFPGTYDEWRECITVRCRIPLTLSFVQSRVEALDDPTHPQTAEFVERYGAEYHQQILEWFRIAERECG